MVSGSPEGPGATTLPGRLEAFGFPARPVRIEALARSASWRMTRALLAAGISVGIAPLVALVPPHIPWALAALITGGVLARNRLLERFTLRSIDASCPRCGEPVTSPAGRITAERTLQCHSCRQDLLLKLDL